jgi:transposase
MKKKTTKKSKVNQDVTKTFIEMPVVNPKAAGIDVGSRSFFVCVGQGPMDVKEYGVFTCNLHEIANDLKELDFKTVAMESTGFYWKQLFVLLQDYGFEVILINARHLKNVKGRKTDVVDARWIQLMHSLGLLSASFQPDNLTEELRAYTRQRQYLIEQAARQVLRINKNLTLMNLQLKPILRDLVGFTGQSIIEAILKGVREPLKLAELIHPNCKHPKEDFVKALQGNYREEYLFELGQCYDTYKHFKKQIDICDSKINQLLEHFIFIQEQNNQNHDVLHKSKQNNYKPPKNIKFKNCPPPQIAQYAYQLSGGIELLNIPGVNTGTILNLMSEIGLNMEKFKTAKHFCSWLGLAPNNKITGGKIISSRTERKKNRVALAFRDAANAIERMTKNTPLKTFLKRIAAKKSRLVAITATARKIATIIWNMLTKKEQFNYKIAEDFQEILKSKKIKTLNRIIKEFGITYSEINFQ